MTYKYKASYGSLPLCMQGHVRYATESTETCQQIVEGDTVYRDMSTTRHRIQKDLNYVNGQRDVSRIIKEIVKVYREMSTDI